MHKVFTYGTLMQNRKKTHIINAKMWTVGPFPCVKLGGDLEVKGQVLEVTTEELNNLDRYEGVPSMYTRELVEATSMDNGEIEECWVYEWAQKTDGLEAIKEWV